MEKITFLAIFLALGSLANYAESSPFNFGSNITTLATNVISTLSGNIPFQDDILENFSGGYGKVDPMVFMNIQEIVEYYGYAVETHHVNSSNYRLEMHRIPRGREAHVTSKPKMENIPVFIQHGLSGSSDDFVMNPPSQSIAFILADLGFDVWLGNIRGNKHSRFNYNITDDKEEFWNYNFDDFIQFDVPNMIDYILKFTGERRVYYIGHSMGTTIGFGMFADRPEYNDKVKAFFALGPAVFFPEPNGLPKVVKFFTLVLEHSPNMLIARENNPYIFTIPVLSDILEFSFETELAYIMGDGYGTLNSSRVAIYASHAPSGAALRSFAHFGQLVVSNKFQKYDYGKLENMKRYNQWDPPEYNLDRVTVPTYLFAAKNDLGTTIEGAKLVGDKIANCKGVYEVGGPRNGHMWYILGPDAYIHLYPLIIDAMK